MSISKKLLSIFLCVVMLVGIVAVGIHAMADEADESLAIPTYADLQEQYGDNPFTYYALRFKDSEGNFVAKDAQLHVGAEYTLELYFMSSETVYGTTYVMYATDPALFNYTEASGETLVGADTTKSTKTAFAKDGTAHSEIVSSTGIDAADVANWGGGRITLVSGTATSTFKGNGAEATAPVFSKTVTVKDSALKGTAAVDVSFFQNVNTKYADGVSPIGKIALTARNTFPAITNFVVDGIYNFTTDKKFTVSFSSADGTETYSSEEYSYGDTIVIPEVEGVSAWQCEGELATEGMTATKDMAFAAVDGNTPVNITLSVSNGTIDGEASKAITATIGNGSLDLTAYVPVADEGNNATFAGWKDAEGNKYTDSYPITSLDDVTLTAFWAGGIDILLQCYVPDPNAETDVGKGTWEYKVLDTYYGDYGASVTPEDYKNMVALCKSHEDEIQELSGISKFSDRQGNPYGFTLMYGSNGKWSDTIDTNIPSANHPSYFGQKSDTPLTAKPIDTQWFGRNYYKFGSTENFVLYTGIVFTADYYKPVRDGEGNIVEKEDGVFGKDWTHTKSATTAYISLCDGYTNGTTSMTIARTVDVSQSVPGEVLSFPEVDPLKDNVVNKNPEGLVFGDDPANPRLMLANRDKNEDGSLSQHFSVYSDVEQRVYRIGLYTDRNGGTSSRYVSYNELHYGDKIKLSSFGDINTESLVNAGSENGKFAFDSLYEDGAPADNRGYKLDKVFLKADGSVPDEPGEPDGPVEPGEPDGPVEPGEPDGPTEPGEPEGPTEPETEAPVHEEQLAKPSENDTIIDGNTEITIDSAFIDKYVKTVEGISYFYFFTSWIPKEYKVNLYYLDSSSNWVKAVTKSFSGSKIVTYKDFVDDELFAVIEDSCPEQISPIKNALSVSSEITASGNASATNIYAYTAEDGEGGELSVYIHYIAGVRAAFVDFNNGVNDLGEVNEDKVGEGLRYHAEPALKYGAVLHDPNYNPESEETEPVFYSKLYGFAPDSMSAPAGDDSKDLKAETPERPYRNCEFVGFKVYYVDGIYLNFEDLPAQSEWKEGYNDRNETGAQHLYTTTILQMQWMNDKDFLFRVYDDASCISWALGRNFKSYYWKPISGTGTNAIPCTKAEIIHCQDPENTVNILFLPKKDVDGSFYFYHLSIGKEFLNLITYARLIPTVIDLLKSGMISQLLG